jgi:hypothetical protein
MEKLCMGWGLGVSRVLLLFGGFLLLSVIPASQQDF